MADTETQAFYWASPQGVREEGHSHVEPFIHAALYLGHWVKHHWFPN
jgi:hypothetical protein